MNALDLKTEGLTDILVTRRFEASPEAVFRAHTDPTLIQKWLLGPDGWHMPVCISEPRPGGKIRYEWSNGKGQSFSLTGQYIEVEHGKRIVHVERMHLPDATPENRVETVFEPDGSGTIMRMRMTLPNAEARARLLESGMDKGMELSYKRLETITA